VGILLIVTALTRALELFPQCNVIHDAARGVLIRHRAVHVGIATQTPDGLKVPVVRNAQSLALAQLAAEIRRVTERARTNKATREELVGSTITVGGNSATLSNATSTPATWSLTTSTPANATVTVTNSSGSTAYSGTLSLNAGTQSFTWNGQGSNGQTWPDGVYTLSVKATGANGQPAFAAYRRGGDGGYHAHAIVVLEVRGAALARIVSFLDPGLFPVFGLPPMTPGRQASTTALKS